MKNIFNQGNIVYSISVNDNLVVDVTKLIVSSFFFNNIPEINKYIYSCIRLENIIIKDYQIEDQELKSSKTISGSYSESSLCFKKELDEKIKTAVQEKIKQNDSIRVALEQFRCPITCDLLKRKDWDRHTLDGPTIYITENSNLIWETYPRDWDFNIYHTTYQNVYYSFLYLGKGEWKEVLEIKGSNGGGIYVDKNLHDSGDESILKQVADFLFLQDEACKKWKINITSSTAIFSQIKPVQPKLINNELIEVSPMPSPSGTFLFLDYPKKEKIVINIENEGRYEIDLDTFKCWNCKELEENKFEFGNTKFVIEK